MLTLPDAIIAGLAPFATLFSNPIWRKAQLLLAGATLTPGQRTVAAAPQTRRFAAAQVCRRGTPGPAQRAVPEMLLEHRCRKG